MNTHSRNTWSIALACFLGAFIGALVSLELAARFAFGKMLWPIGAILGGVIGWIACDPKEFWKQAIRECGERIKNCRFDLRHYLADQIQRTNLKSVMDSIYVILLVALWLLPAYYICILRFLGSASTTNRLEDMTGEILVLSAPAILFAGGTYLFCLVFLVSLTLAIDIFCELDLRAQLPLDEGSKTNSPIGFLLITNPLVMLPCALVGLVVSILVIVWKVTSVAYKIIQSVFIKVHSEKRLICLVDSAIGATIGYYCGSAVIGGLAGSIIGVVNYELVSIRWLKLVSRS